MPTDFSALNNYFNRPAGQLNLAPAAADVAKFITLNAQNSGPSKGAKGNDSSFMSKLFDILSRPNYAVANLVQDTIDKAKDPSREFNPYSSVVSGLAGTQKTTFQDVLKHEGASDSIGTALLGLGLDIGLDPTSYASGAPIIKGASKIAELLGKGKKATGVVDKELPLAQKLLNQGEPVNPELFGLPKEGGEVPAALAKPLDAPDIARDTMSGVPTKPGQLELDFPGVPKAKEIKVPEAGVAKPPVEKQLKGQQALKFPDFDVKAIQEMSKVTNAEQIIDHLKAGDIEKALEIAPPLKAAPDVIHDITADHILEKLNKFQNPQLDKVSAVQQANLWGKSEDLASMMGKGKPGSKIKGKNTQMHAEKIYNALEGKLAAAGKMPVISTGEHVAFSDVVGDLKARGVPITPDVAKEFAKTKINPFSDVGRAIERIRARNAINDSIPVKQTVDAVHEAKATVQATGSLSDASEMNFDKFLKDFSKNVAKAQNVSPAARAATQQLTNMALNAGKSSAIIYQQRVAHQLAQIVASGKVNSKVNHDLTLALEKDMGKLPKWAVNDNKAMEWTMARVATWWGQSDLRPMTLNAMASAGSTAEARGKVLMKMFEPLTDLERAEAFRIAQGAGTAPSTPQVASLAGQITNMMSDLAAKTAGGSVLIRSGVDMGLLNKWMRRYKAGFEFTKDAAVRHPITGQDVDFSKGADWLDSWKVADASKDPATLMFKTMEAVEQATREKSVFDELGERFGSTFYGKEYRTRVQGHPYLAGYYFPEDIAKQIPRMVRDWTVGSGTNNNALKMYDKVLSMWKTLATIYRPAHHIRNLVGDVYMGMMDGVNSPVPYALALRALRTQKGAYTTMKDIDQLVEIGAVSKRSATPLPGATLFHTKAGVPITAEQIYAVAHQKGLFESVATLEDIIDLGSGMPGWSLSKPLGGKAQAVARSASEFENNFTRLGHFIDVVMKSKSKDLPKVFEEAAQRTRKFHPTGLDLTDFEKKYLRRIIPFYSWMRKSTPVLLEGMVMKPGITLLPAKINEAIQMANGIDTTRDDPFPVDQLFPQWIRDEGIGPVALPDSVMAKFTNQKPEGYVQAGTGLNPLTTLIAELQHPGKTLGSGLTPALQIPLELGITGRKTFTGEPITGPDAKPDALQQYLGEQIPIWSAVQGMTGVTPFGTSTKRAAQSDNQSGRENLFNWLTGLGIKGTGPYVKSARYEKYTPVQQDRAAKKQDFLAELKDQLGS
jgi:hypothetical protein